MSMGYVGLRVTWVNYESMWPELRSLLVRNFARRSRPGTPVKVKRDETGFTLYRTWETDQQEAGR